MPNKEPVNILPLRDYCVRTAGVDCQRCAMACPWQAIAYDKGAAVRIDEQRCKSCGICMGVCDAFSAPFCGSEQLLARFQRISLQGETVLVTCREYVQAQRRQNSDLASNLVVLHCLAQMPPELWTAAFADGIDIALACDFKMCENCTLTQGRGAALFQHAIEAASIWTGSEPGFQDTLPLQDRLFSRSSSEDADREQRGLSDFVQTLGAVAKGEYRLRTSESLQRETEGTLLRNLQQALPFSDIPSYNALVPDRRFKRILHPRRQVLLHAVYQHPEWADRIPLSVSQTDPALCEGCLQCTRVCPTGARVPAAKTKQAESLVDEGQRTPAQTSRSEHEAHVRAEHAGDTLFGAEQLSFNVCFCIGCGKCVSSCDNKAAHMVEETASCLL